MRCSALPQIAFLALWASCRCTCFADDLSLSDTEAEEEEWETLAADNERRTYDGTGGYTQGTFPWRHGRPREGRPRGDGGNNDNRTTCARSRKEKQKYIALLYLLYLHNLGADVAEVDIDTE